jgi:hypothetical protein
MSGADLLQKNFKLTTENRQLRGEIASLRAIQHREDSLEVARIKQAYEELETELVTLRREKISQPTVSKFVEEDSSSEDDNGLIIDVLTRQLEEEKNARRAVEELYLAARSKSSVTYSEPSTCASSPCYVRPLSVERYLAVEIKPPIEEMFKHSGKGRRTVVIEARGPPQRVSVSPLRKRPARTDPAVSRLAKIAKFR